ncbi:hypothetical protein N7G274_009823 [Stereocaulon virgatum]|uniref:Uncharacterized protein n=1 Tax=Stereocaulon virgatum TaxID=373712 RepID=A0ABR3ZX61_9LECA
MMMFDRRLSIVLLCVDERCYSIKGIRGPLYIALMTSRTFQNMSHSWIVSCIIEAWNILEYESYIVRLHHRTMEHSRMESPSRTFQDGISWNLLESSGIFWNLLEHSRIESPRIS